MQFKKTIDNKILINKKGYTLVEMLIYIAILGIISVMVAGIFVTISRTNNRIVSLVEINSNAYSAMERITYETNNASHIYLPTSNFINDSAYDPLKPAQFSIATKQGISSSESIGFIDFYLQNNTIFMKQEGVSPVALTSSNVLVESFNLNYYKNDTRESVKIDFTVHPNNALSSEAVINLTTVVALRS